MKISGKRKGSKAAWQKQGTEGRKMRLNIDTNFECMGTGKERYVPGGYHDAMGVDERLEVMSNIKGLSGLFTFYPPTPLPSDPGDLVKKLSDFGLQVSNICVVGWNDRKWKYGAYSTREDKIRQQAIKLLQLSRLELLNSFAKK